MNYATLIAEENRKRKAPVLEKIRKISKELKVLCWDKAQIKKQIILKKARLIELHEERNDD